MNDTQNEADVFLAAIEMDASDSRAAYLDSVCGQDEQLRRRVEALLRRHVQSKGVLDEPPPGLAATELLSIAEEPGDMIGPYRLLRQIGEGGMGVVFVAEQTEPVHRMVALKIIKPGMDSRQVIARFAAERQALVLMDHSNIARVLDAGATETGRPYFVMDLVNGTPITDYCDAQHLDIQERLQLFAKVCQAVQHAHQKGIIHRDLKPSNILVAERDGRPEPKIIDFGVAKATSERLSEQPMFTRVGQIIGTFEYMSPEQAQFDPLDVDTRSDIYSLGVLLYELLAGGTPFQKERLQSATFDEILRIIRDEEPPRPSVRLADSESLPTIAANRWLEPTRLCRLVRGELDWVVMKALDKDRDRRYESASALAADVTHYLTNEPVTAAAPSRAYRISKFVRRNKLTVIASAALLAGLVAGIVGTTIGLVSQSRQRAIAERERAEVQLNYAVALQAQRKYADAEALYRQGLSIPGGDTPADRQRVALTRLRLAEVINDSRGAAEAEKLYQEALASYREAYAPSDPNIAHVLTDLAIVLRTQQKFAQAEPLFREAYEIHRQAVPADHRAIGESTAVLANVLISLGRYADAEPLAREAIAEHERAVPRDEWSLAFARQEFGRDLLSLGRYSEAEAQLLESERALMTTEGFLNGPLALAALYTKWDQAEPGKGYDAKAQKWFRKLIGTFVPTERTSIESKTDTQPDPE